MAPKVKFATKPPEAPAPVAPVEEASAETVAVEKPFEEMTHEELMAVDQSYLTEDELAKVTKLIKKLAPKEPDAEEPEKDLRTDGPTLEEWVNRGYKASAYPSKGYAARASVAPANAMSVDQARIAESRKVLGQPLAKHQRLFEAPDGTIIVGDADKDQVWFGRLNGGKGGWINPHR